MAADTIFRHAFGLHKASADVRDAQFASLTRQIPILYGVLAVNTAVMSYSVHDLASVGLTVYAPVAFFTLIAIRMIVWLGRRRGEVAPELVAIQLRTTTIIATIVSLCLGYWTASLLSYPAVSATPFVPLFSAMGSVACAYCLASVPPAAYATIICAVTPVCFKLIQSGDGGKIAVALNLMLIFALLFSVIADQYRALVSFVSSHAQVHGLAYRDHLTQLPNRRAFLDRILSATDSASEPVAPFVLAMIDLDGFKAINDTFGHAVGDSVLKEAARRIDAICRSGDFAARLGGDEFAILFNGVTDCADATILARSLSLSLQEPFKAEESQLRLAASIGLARYPFDGDRPAILMSRADMALYEAKRGGGRRLSFFEPKLEAVFQRRTTLEQALRATDPLPDIQVVYQPIVDTFTGRIAAFEALARWSHPVLGSVPPGEFIELAEATGVIGALAERLFDVAVAQAARWPAHIRLSLNLSAVQLADPATPLMIMSLLDRHGLPAGRLEMEVTETSVMTDFTAARTILNLLREAGVRIVLDDFGAGYASIGYLKEIVFDGVKIDGDLIAGIVESPRVRSLLDGILHLCRAIGVRTTAEKVETDAEFQLLRQLGCDRLQGYLLGKPADEETTLRIANASTIRCPTRLRAS
jgi:diguanylate cyclase (GGDEF)-like protein